MPVAWVCYRAGLTSTVATVLVTIPVCTLASVALGHVFHRVVERRFLNSPAPTRPAEKQVPTSVPCPV